MRPVGMLLARMLAAVGTAAHRVDRLVRHVLGWVRLSWLPGGLLVGVGLAWLTVSTVLSTVAAFDERPEPRSTSLAAVARGEVGSSSWVLMPALVSFDAFEAEVNVFEGGAAVDAVLYQYVLARDPDEPGMALVLRHRADVPSPLRRTMDVTAVADADEAAAARDALGAAAAGADARIVLVEEPDGAPSAAAAKSPAALADVVDGGGPRIVDVRLEMVSAPADGGQHWYLVADEASGRRYVMRSPHPSDRVPAWVAGTIVEDRFHMRLLLADWQPQGRFGGIEVLSDTRLLAWGSGPSFREPSWIPAVLAGVLTVLVLAGLAVGYPRFVRSDGAAAGHLAARREAVDVQLIGRLPGPRGELRIDRIPGTLEWLPVSEVARTRWRYWGAALGDFRRDVEAAVREAGGDGEQLVVHSPVGSLMWSIESAKSPVVEAGEALVGLGRHPAVRIVARGTRLHLLFADSAARDRALAEVRVALSGGP